MTDRLNEKMGKSQEPSDTRSGLAGGAAIAFGLQFAIGIFLFLYIGKWIDSRLGTAPVGLVTGVFIGAAGSFYLFYRRLTTAQRRDDVLHGRSVR